MRSSAKQKDLQGTSSRGRGFTLIELMIVVAIVAILAAIAYPGYQSYIREARRADAKEPLLRVQIEQEKWRTNNASYTATLGDLGLSSTSPDGYYTIAITAGSTSGTAYTATAAAVAGKSQASDTGCTTLTLAVDAGGETTTPSGCW